MASSINPNNIRVTFPIAGQDNDSQGFRDNFNNIKTNITYAKSEIEDLQNKVVLKSALTGSSLNNDGAGAVIKNFKMEDMAETKLDKGSNSGSVTIEVDKAPLQLVSTSGNITLAFTGFPASGSNGSVVVEFDITNDTHTVTVPSAASVGVSEIAGYDSSSRAIGFTATGKFRFKFSSHDGGSTIAVEDLNRAPARIHSQKLRISPISSPPAATGQTGDTAGMIAVDSDNIYIAVANYDGTTTVWKKVALVAI
jgi:hypothetical protein